MNTITYRATANNESLGEFDTWLEAARKLMTHDGYVYEVREIDTYDCILQGETVPDKETVRENYGDFALFVKSSHNGNNCYAPQCITTTRGDFTSLTSKKEDIEEAEEELLREYQIVGNGSLHPKFQQHFVDELEYDGDAIAM